MLTVKVKLRFDLLSVCRDNVRGDFRGILGRYQTQTASLMTIKMSQRLSEASATQTEHYHLHDKEDLWQDCYSYLGVCKVSNQDKGKHVCRTSLKGQLAPVLMEKPGEVSQKFTKHFWSFTAKQCCIHRWRKKTKTKLYTAHLKSLEAPRSQIDLKSWIHCSVMKVSVFASFKSIWDLWASVDFAFLY